MPMERREILSLELTAELATVWEHLRDPALARRWFGTGGPGSDEEIRRDLIEGADEGRLIEHDSTTHTLTWPNHDVLAVSAAAHEPRHTRLVVTRPSHDAYGHGYDGVLDDRDERWIANAHQLQFALRVHPGQERRTLAAQDLDAGPRPARLLDQAGLHGIRGVPVGGHVQARRPDGTLLGGTLLYKTEHQLGLQLHGTTESLLIVRETPAGTRPPNGTVSPVLSVYGLDDETFAQVERRWESWWQGAGAKPAGTQVGA